MFIREPTKGKKVKCYEKSEKEETKTKLNSEKQNQYI